jgi:zinc protease
LLSGWKAAVPFQRIAHSANLEVKGVKHNMLTPDKKNAIFLAAHSLALTLTDPDYAALKIGNYALGGGPLSSRLANRVRQKEGLSYGIASQFQADARDKSAQLFIFAISNPQNIDKVDRAIAEELDKFLKGGVDAAELAEAQKSYLQQEKVRRANDGMLAAMLVTGLFYDRTFEHQSNLEKKIAALTPDAVNTAVRKHFTPQRLVIIRAGDFGKP